VHLDELVGGRPRVGGSLDEAEDAASVTIEDVPLVAAATVRVLVKRERARQIDDVLADQSSGAIVTRFVTKRDKLHGRVL